LGKSKTIGKISKMSKTALITGASGGIGYELAKVSAGNDVNLVLVARSKDKLDKLKNEIEGKGRVWVHTIGKDLSLPGAAQEVYDEIKGRSISVDYLINNAGFGDFGLFADSNWNKQEQMINLNVTALAHMTRLILPDMICRGGGRILNVASTASFQPGPTMSVYFASKAFVLSFSEALNNEVRDLGITVTALCPGATHSNFQSVSSGRDRKYFEHNKFPSASEVAEYGYRAMMKGKVVAIHGLKNRILANAIRFAPRSLVVKFTRRVQAKKY
jgi:uncharacterized protein